MKKILTIDFDIVMAPSIEEYNHLIPSHSWEQILKILCKCPEMDYEIYEIISYIIMQNLKNLSKDNIHFITNHKDIINFLPKEEIILTNIDHHHDLGYPLSPKNKYDSSNWAQYLINTNRIKEYKWINNYSSVADGHLYTHLKDYENFDDFLNMDKIIICLSPDWVPNQYYYLYYTLIDICNCFLDANLILL